jgi:hypothetical protein
MDTSLPIGADINYNLNAVTLGFDYIGIGRSYKTTSSNRQNVYVDLSNLEFAGYSQLNLLNNSTLVRAKIGYATSSYEIYDEREKVDLTIAAFSFGDDRTLLYPKMNGSFFAKLEIIYRFNIPEKE